MVKRVHKKMFSNRSPFSQAMAAAFIIALGDVFCCLADIDWLIHDTHYSAWSVWYVTVAILMGIALVLIIGSFVWLYISLDIFFKKKEKKEQDLLKRITSLENSMHYHHKNGI